MNYMSETMLTVGQLFDSYEEVEKAMEHYENVNNLKFMKRHSRRLNPSREFFKTYNANLCYSQIHYICIKGGDFKKRGQGLRERTTIKQGCPAQVSFKITSDGMHLKVKSIEKEHNHEVTEQWVYFKGGIARSVRRKLGLKGAYIRNSTYLLNGDINLQAALVEKRALENLQQKIRPDEEVVMATQSLSENELIKTVKTFTKCQESSPTRSVEDSFSSFPEEGLTDSPEKKLSIEEGLESVVKTQSIILNTLDLLNENIQTLSTNMLTMTTAINNLAASVNNITHIVLP